MATRRGGVNEGHQGVDQSSDNVDHTHTPMVSEFIHALIFAVEYTVYCSLCKL